MNDNMRDLGIYSIQSPDNHIYVGMTTVSFHQRFMKHKNLLANPNRVHHCLYLQNLYNKYGEDYFQYRILDAFQKDTINPDELAVKEVYWWDKMKSENFIMLNGRPTGTGSVYHDKPTKEKITSGLLSYHGNRAKILKNLEEIKTLLNDETVSVSDISKQFDISFKAMKIFLREENLSSVYSKKKVNYDLFPIAEWVADNLSTREIAKRVGCSQPAIVGYLKQLRKNENLTGL